MQSLSAEELRQFQLITENARHAGWLKPDSTLVAERFETSIRVAAVRGAIVVEKTYARDGQWLYQLLRDLAWGTYAAGIPPQPG